MHPDAILPINGLLLAMCLGQNGDLMAALSQLTGQLIDEDRNPAAQIGRAFGRHEGEADSCLRWFCEGDGLEVGGIGKTVRPSGEAVRVTEGQFDALAQSVCNLQLQLFELLSRNALGFEMVLGRA